MSGVPGDIVELVHTRTVEILSEVGFCVPEREALARLQAAGFPVDQDSQMVRITTELLDEALSRLPHDVCLHDRSGTTPVPFGQSSCFMGAGTPVNVLDLETGERRPATRQDVRNLVRLQDALSNCVGPNMACPSRCSAWLWVAPQLPPPCWASWS